MNRRDLERAVDEEVARSARLNFIGTLIAPLADFAFDVGGAKDWVKRRLAGSHAKKPRKQARRSRRAPKRGAR